MEKKQVPGDQKSNTKTFLLKMFKFLQKKMGDGVVGCHEVIIIEC